MKLSAGLQAVAMGEASLQDASTAIRGALRSAEPKDVSGILYALRSWVFRALRSRVRHDELGDWIDLLSKVSAQLEGGVATKIEAYLELLQMSSARADAEEALDPLRGRHALAVMRCLHLAGRGVHKSELMSELRLKQANLSHVMSPLVDAGLVHSGMVGKHRVYRLTPSGRQLAEERMPALRLASEERVPQIIGLYQGSFRVPERRFADPLQIGSQMLVVGAAMEPELVEQEYEHSGLATSIALRSDTQDRLIRADALDQKQANI